MTFKYNRFDVRIPMGSTPEDIIDPAMDGTLVLAEDAINREAVNAAKIATLEAQLRQWKARAKDAEDYVDETGK